MTFPRAVLPAVLVLFAVPAMAEPPAEACDQIRIEIQSKRGIPDQVDTVLLKKIADRTDCRFSAAEVFRAAHGDKPIPQEVPRERYLSDHEEGD